MLMLIAVAGWSFPLFFTALNAAPASRDEHTSYETSTISSDSTLEVNGGKIKVVFAPGEIDLPRERVMAWIENSARAVTDYYGRFPVPYARILVTPKTGRGVLSGTAHGYGGAAIRTTLGRATRESDLDRDWIMTHEMVHLAFPSLADRHSWVSEGIATYVEPLARVGIGQLSAERVWGDLVKGLPQGLPKSGDRGLDHTPTWGRTYWGGALFFLLADIEIHERTANRHDLRDALRAINAAGGTIESDMSLTRAFTLGDRAVGEPVLMELYKHMKAAPAPVDLEKLWRRLGVNLRGQTVTFDESAPLAAVRRAITHSSARATLQKTTAATR